MPLNTEERAEINRENARKSTGPRTDAGKGKARQNALKHGLRAEALALPNEDPEAVRARTEAWNDHYQPRDPAAQHLVNRCVAATLLADRCARHQASILSDQVRKAADQFDADQQDEVARLSELLLTDPATALRHLQRTAAGCRYLISRWEHLGASVELRGWWFNSECDEAIRLQGERTDSTPHSPDAWITRLNNLLADEAHTPGELAWLSDPSRVPDRFHHVAKVGEYFDAATCRGHLKIEVETRLAALRAQEESLRTRIEAPGRAEAGDRALLIEGPRGALFLRYERMHDSAFHRAYAALLKDRRDNPPDTGADQNHDGPGVAHAEDAPHAPMPSPQPQEEEDVAECDPPDAGPGSAAEVEAPNEANPAEAEAPNEASPAEAEAPNEANPPRLSPPCEAIDGVAEASPMVPEGLVWSPEW